MDESEILVLFLSGLAIVGGLGYLFMKSHRTYTIEQIIEDLMTLKPVEERTYRIIDNDALMIRRQIESRFGRFYQISVETSDLIASFRDEETVHKVHVVCQVSE